MSFVAAAIVGAGVVGAVGSYMGGKAQAGAAQNAADIGLGEFNTITGQEQPFMNAGRASLFPLEQLLGIGPVSRPGAGGSYGSLLKPFTADMMKEYSPGYQFQLEQGKQGVLNGDASGIGALSGAAQKDLMGYNQNLANTAFNNAFNQYQTQNQNVYNRLFGLSQLGQTSAANTGAAGSSLIGQGVMPAIANIGASQGAATVGIANSLSGAVQGAAPWLYANKTPVDTSLIGATPG